MRTGPGRVVALVVGGVLLTAVVAAVVLAVRPTPRLDVGTPEGTVQAYLEAVLAGDHDEAAGHLDPDGPCSVEDLEDAFAESPGRVVLDDVTTTGDTARVRVELVHGGDPFGDEWTETQSYRLARDGAGWVLQDTPWPLYACGGEPR